MDGEAILPLNESQELSQDSSVSVFEEKVLQSIYIVIGVVSFIGNTFVVSVLLSNGLIRQKVTNVYLINQGIIDALAGALISGFALSATDGTDLEGVSGDLLCRLWLTRFPIWSMVMNSTYSLLALTVDRYVRIVYPVQYKNRFTRRKLFVIIAFTWIFGPVYNFSWKWPTSGLVNGQCQAFAIWPNDLTARVVGVLTVFFQYCLPLFVLVLCYTRIILALRQRIKPKQDVEVTPVEDIRQGRTLKTSSSTRKNDNFERAKNNIIKTLILVAACFVLCWTWNEVFIFLYFVGYPTDFTSTFYHFSVVAVFSNGCINPFIYCTKYEDFKTSVRMLFCKKQSKNKRPESGATKLGDLQD